MRILHRSLKSILFELIVLRHPFHVIYILNMYFAFYLYFACSESQITLMVWGIFFLRRLLFSPCSLLADLFSIFMCFYHFFFFPDSNFSEFIWLFLESPNHCGNCCLSVLKIRCFFVLCVHAFFNFFPLMRFLMNPQTCHALWHLFLTYLLFPHL